MTYYNHPADEPNSPTWDSEPEFNWIEFVYDMLELPAENIQKFSNELIVDLDIDAEETITFKEFSIEVNTPVHDYNIDVYDYQNISNVWTKEDLKALISLAYVKGSKGAKEQSI